MWLEDQCVSNKIFLLPLSALPYIIIYRMLQNLCCKLWLPIEDLKNNTFSSFYQWKWSKIFSFWDIMLRNLKKLAPFWQKFYHGTYTLEICFAYKAPEKSPSLFLIEIWISEQKTKSEQKRDFGWAVSNLSSFTCFFA